MKAYLPLASVTWLETVPPEASSRVTLTPGRPGSPASCRPLPFRSFQTVSPIAAYWYIPASQLLSFWPETSVTVLDLPPVDGLALLSAEALPFI